MPPVYTARRGLMAFGEMHTPWNRQVFIRDKATLLHFWEGNSVSSVDCVLHSSNLLRTDIASANLQNSLVSHCYYPLHFTNETLTSEGIPLLGKLWIQLSDATVCYVLSLQVSELSVLQNYQTGGQLDEWLLNFGLDPQQEIMTVIHTCTHTHILTCPSIKM